MYITKTGPKEIMGGQPVRYTFSGIANHNVRLDSFYWRIPSPPGAAGYCCHRRTSRHL